MSEVVTIDPKMPEGYEMLSRIEVHPGDDSKPERSYGIVELGKGAASIERKVQLPNLEEIWGVDVEEAEYYHSDPRGWEREQRQVEMIHQLQDRLRQLEEKLGQGGSNASGKPEAIVDIAEGKKDITEVQPGDLLTVKSRKDGGETQGVAVSGVWPSSKDGKERITLIVDDKPKAFQLEELTFRDEDFESSLITPKIVASEQENLGLRGRYNRAVGHIGAFITGRSALIAIERKMIEREDKKISVIMTEEEEIDGFTESDRRTGNIALASVVTAGALAVGAYFLGRYTGHHIVNHYYENKTPSNGAHIDFYNPAPGHRLSGAVLPKNLHITSLSGRDVIIDNKGQMVVGHLKEGLFDRQGNLSRGARAVLRSKGHVLSQLPFGGRFITEVS